MTPQIKQLRAQVRAALPHLIDEIREDKAATKKCQRENNGCGSYNTGLATTAHVLCMLLAHSRGYGHIHAKAATLAEQAESLRAYLGSYLSLSIEVEHAAGELLIAANAFQASLLEGVIEAAAE